MAENETETKPAKAAFAEDALDSSKWPPAKRRAYNVQVQQAYQDGWESGKDVECINFGSLANKQGSLTSCPCRNCSGARASLAKQKELTGLDPLKPPQN